MACLYVTEQGAVLRKSGASLVIEQDGAQILNVETHRLKSVILFGNVQFTTQALNLLLDNGIEMALLSYAGKLRGKLTPPTSKNVLLRRNQYELFTNPNVCQDLARHLVKSKIRNSLETLRQFDWNDSKLDLHAEIDEISSTIVNVDNATTITTLNGYEGTAAKLYFEAYQKVFKEPALFNGRSKRPPRDPGNALLSFGYVLLNSVVQSLLEAAGFDPFLGFYHHPSYGRPSLALDMLEAFRAPIVDRLAVKILNLKIIKRKDFESTEKTGFKLRPQGLKKYFRSWDKQLGQMEFRTHLKRQIESLGRFCRKETEAPEYYFFRAR